MRMRKCEKALFNAFLLLTKTPNPLSPHFNALRENIELTSTHFDELRENIELTSNPRTQEPYITLVSPEWGSG
jgi:hypothetical protein